MKTTLKLHSALALGLLLISANSYAGKYDLMFGGYSYTASVSGKSVALSGLGTYEAAYLVAFKEHFEMNLGYSFTMTGIIGGDYAFGPKIGVNYFPLNFASNDKIEIPGTTIEVHDSYKPYVGIAFNQRQFQSAKTSYAGFGFSLGCEKYINPKYTIKSELKMNKYTGASDATASEVNLLVGLVFSF
jgi:hypothetical protein